MTACGEDGILKGFLGLSRLGYGNSLEEGSGTSLDLFDLMWVMGLKSDFGNMCGLGIRP